MCRSELLWFVFLALCCSFAVAAGNFQLTLLHTGDTEGEVQPVDIFNAACIPYLNGTYVSVNIPGTCMGGMARRKAYIDSVRSSVTNTLLVDSGNALSGSLYFFLFGVDMMAEFYNDISYNAFRLDTSDFVPGRGALASFIKMLPSTDFVSNNLIYETDAAMAGLPINPYAIFNFSGELVGVTGVITYGFTKLFDEPGNVTATDELSGMRDAVAALQNQGVNKIIGITTAESYADVVSQIYGLDVIIISKTLMSNNTAGTFDVPAGPYPTVVTTPWNQPVLVVGAGMYGKRIGRLDLTFNGFGVVTGYQGEAKQLDDSSPYDATIQTRLVEYYNQLVNSTSEVIGWANVTLGFETNCLFSECVIGDWATDVLRKNVGAQIAFMNGGAILAGFPQGSITLGEYIYAFPFGTNLQSTFELQGQYVLEALESGLYYANDTNIPNPLSFGAGRFPQVSGLKFTWNPTQPIGWRVVDVWVETSSGTWDYLDMNENYTVTAFNYVAQGGDGYSVFQKHAINPNYFGQSSDRIFLNAISTQSPLSATWQSRSNLTTETRLNCLAPDGTLCSDHGTCRGGMCTCDSGYSGTTCELSNMSSSNSDTLAIVLGTVLPIVFLLIAILVAVVLVILFITWRVTRQEEEEWYVNHDEIEFQERLGAGAFGEVFKASWKGTEVAIKVMHTGNVSKEMKNNFVEEMRVMNTLRHPNIVLFMGASSKPPKMCILMEFMTLGSLYEVLHNELIAAIPHSLQLKIALGAAKGMHFLHSSDIVHRDLKSLNLLLDEKWNVKVSDFGLTKFKDHIKRDDALQGSIHWTAPEVLGQQQDVDYALADVYSFGIILWELLTREDPYSGMSTAAVAVGVLRDELRPDIPDYAPDEYVKLMTNCWDQDPSVRPTFLEIMTRLEGMIGETSSSRTYGSASSMSDLGSRMSSMSDDDKDIKLHTDGEVAPPSGDVVIVITDIMKAGALWEFNPDAMRDATILHNDLIRSLIKKHGGYEGALLRNASTGEGSFCVAFQEVSPALEWCMDVQQALLDVEWPEALLAHPAAAEELGDVEDKVIFKGLRVRMGVNYGQPKLVKDPVSRRIEYIGPIVNVAARITALAHGGQILISSKVKKLLKEESLGKEKNRIHFYRMLTGTKKKDSKLFEVKVRGLESRFFASPDDEDDKGKQSDGSTSSSMALGSGTGSDSFEMKSLSGKEEGGDAMPEEDSFLTSANLCRWIIDFKQLSIGKEIGTGTYGTVYRGTWKGVDVAVKRFINQRMTEKVMLGFRAEVAFLSELHHPNVVMFIGACIKKPNLCVVTEYVKKGSLRSVLTDNTIKLRWQQKLMMLRGAAMGINYLHTLNPLLIHRDLKSDNLLVDENWNVKVADFGFARIKEENMTMTRCGTPCWTAPEVIRGEKYSEKADVYSFGIVMWEVLTRKIPYEGRNFMNITMDVLEGRRPQLPIDCPKTYKKLMKSCWHADPAKRPTMAKVLEYFDGELSEQVVDEA
jgi:serine/threonine protein kinase/2',3'-cyclic-nucleotide 2'-phosphodiesterase (5'-nucleotidase family)